MCTLMFTFVFNLLFYFSLPKRDKYHKWHINTLILKVWMIFFKSTESDWLRYGIKYDNIFYIFIFLNANLRHTFLVWILIELLFWSFIYILFCLAFWYILFISFFVVFLSILFYPSVFITCHLLFYYLFIHLFTHFLYLYHYFILLLSILILPGVSSLQIESNDGVSSVRLCVCSCLCLCGRGSTVLLFLLCEALC